MVPEVGTAIGAGIANTLSGCPITQPSVNAIGFGASFLSPALAPLSTQETRVLMSAADKLRSFENLPCAGSANHGGIFLLTTTCLMALAHGRVLSYVMNDIGPGSPGRWQPWQLFSRTGRTSL